MTRQARRARSTPAVPAPATVIVGIDAGGTRTRALARHGDTVVHEGTGGPGNPLSASAAQLARSFGDALDGCPDPAIVAVCAAGSAGADGRGRIERLIRERFPGVTVARAAPVLTAAAEDGHPWATGTLDRQMQALAATTCEHVDRWSYLEARIALSGGVWDSAAARVAFERAVVRRLPGASVALCAAASIEGALALGLEHLAAS